MIKSIPVLVVFFAIDDTIVGWATRPNKPTYFKVITDLLCLTSDVGDYVRYSIAFFNLHAIYSSDLINYKNKLHLAKNFCDITLD